jgi:hypothetical protein
MDITPTQPGFPRRPSMAHYTGSHSTYARSSTSSLRSSIRSSEVSSRSLKSVRFHETVDYIPGPTNELPGTPEPDAHITRPSPQKRNSVLLGKWSMPNLNSRPESAASSTKRQPTQADPEGTEFEAWLARTATLGRVEGYGKDDRRQVVRSSAIGRGPPSPRVSLETKKDRRKSWLNRLSSI